MDKEAYAQKTLELLSRRWGRYTGYALGLMRDSMSPGKAEARVERKLCSEMEDVLFDYLKRSGKVSGAYGHQYYHVTGGYRAVQREPQKRDVPSELLDIRQVLTSYEEVIGNIMMDAEKRWLEEEIEGVAKNKQDY